MYRLIPAAVLALSLSPTAAFGENEPVTIGPLAQAIYSDDDDDRPELFLPSEGDSNPANFYPEEGDSDPSNFTPVDAEAAPDFYDSPDLDELSQPEQPLERALA